MTRDARTTDAANEAVTHAVRDGYGRALGWLAGRFGDIAAAEDALGDAVVRALERWPVDGVPSRPDAWLLTTARRRLLDRGRRRDVAARHEAVVAWLQEEQADAPAPALDPRLPLLYVCAHPAIDAVAQPALMLQTVLQVPTERIAAAFLVAPVTMSQRLVRAKAKIRAAGVPFEVPAAHELEERTDAVLAAVYAAFGTAWAEQLEADHAGGDLRDEAIELARLVHALLPREPEPAGLLALLLYCDARRDARRDDAGAYVPLSRQDTTRWDPAKLHEAEALVRAAAARGRPGRYQLEAAIQSAHLDERRSGASRAADVLDLYGALLHLCPTVGGYVGHAAATARVEGSEAGLACLDRIPAERVRSYQAYWATRAQLLRDAGRLGEAREATERAAGLTSDPAVRAWLVAQLRALTRDEDSA